MKLLVTGAAGFIGSGVVERLLVDGHQVVACARDAANLPASAQLEFQRVDLNRMLDAQQWLPLLDDVDGVINAAGILREYRHGEFEKVHRQAPMALAKACLQKGIRCFVQISALGHADDGEFIASKHRFDQDLLALDGLAAIVLRPSVVVSLRGSYGGTSMLRAMAALPLVLILPGEGKQKIQPLWLEDLAALVGQAVSNKTGSPILIDAVGPDVISLREFLLATRRWLKFPEPIMTISVPMVVVNLAGRLGDWLQAGPLGTTMGRMLARGNVSQQSATQASDMPGFQPRSVLTGLNQSASFVQDRWQARLYPLIPLAWLTLITVWLVSALSGFMADPTGYGPLLDELGVAGAHQSALVLVTSSLNLLLAVALALRRWINLVLVLMLLSVGGYTLGLGLLVPELWLDLTGGLVKNLGLMVLILVVLVLENRR
jgi:uncharacterized protein YbjT (DUF2867 family)